MKRHHYANKGPLPKHVPKHKKHPAEPFLRAKKHG
jgi:hypothetical protein